MLAPSFTLARNAFILFFSFLPASLLHLQRTIRMRVSSKDPLISASDPPHFAVVATSITVLFSRPQPNHPLVGFFLPCNGLLHCSASDLLSKYIKTYVLLVNFFENLLNRLRACTCRVSFSALVRNLFLTNVEFFIFLFHQCHFLAFWADLYPLPRIL